MDADVAYSRLTGKAEVESIKGEKEKPKQVIDQSSYENIIGLGWTDYTPDHPPATKRAQGGSITPTGGASKKSQHNHPVQHPRAAAPVQPVAPVQRVAAPVRRSNSDPTDYSQFSVSARPPSTDAAITSVVIEDLTGCYSIEGPQTSAAALAVEEALSSIDDFLQQQQLPIADRNSSAAREADNEAGLQLLDQPDNDEVGRYSPED